MTKNPPILFRICRFAASAFAQSPTPLRSVSKFGFRISAALLLSSLLFSSGCVSSSAQRVKAATPIRSAPAEIPEDELLDVGIEVFEAGEMTPKQAKKQGTSEEIRKAESHYIPYHLRNTMQKSGHWGAVQVTPVETEAADLRVGGRIIESHGERLTVEVEARDAAGFVWMRKRYRMDAKAGTYLATPGGEAYQALYNTIANDLAMAWEKLPPAERRRIRTISELRFAGDFAPEAFDDYLSADKKGRVTLERLPARDDPMLLRMRSIRERENLFIETLNGHYEIYYQQMKTAYENWRKFNLTERVALRKVKRKGMYQKVGGALLIVAAIALEVEGVEYSSTLRDIMVMAGGQIIMNGINVSAQAEMHAAAIEELSDSFGAEMDPVVLEFEGKTYKLTGSAEEQYSKWRTLLQKIYRTETGLDLPAEALPTP